MCPNLSDHWFVNMLVSSPHDQSGPLLHGELAKADMHARTNQAFVNESCLISFFYGI
jgi:hypothetical protein